MTVEQVSSIQYVYSDNVYQCSREYNDDRTIETPTTRSREYNRRYPLHRFAASRLRASLRSWGNKKIVVTHVTIVMLIPVTIFTPGVREAGEAVIVSLPWECADSVALTDLSTKIVSCEIIETRLIRVDFTHFLYGLCKLAC